MRSGSSLQAKGDFERSPSVAFRMNDWPLLGVVVPAYRSPRVLERCIAALRASDLPAEKWELIVVDDGSSDPETTRVAELADIPITLDPPAGGPARARNAGVRASRAAIVAFVDADVLVHRDALRRIHQAFDDAEVAAVFGSYDANPEARGIVSQYRNLLHHRVHQKNAGEVESFWAGCGAVRKTILESAGMFDEKKYRRPEMEDVELGYRLRDASHRIILDPAILCTHLKRWTLGGMLKSDFTRRGLPWAQLLVERGMLLSPRGLSLGATERVSAVAAVAVVAGALVALACGWIAAAVASVGFLVLFVTLNRDHFGWLKRQRGLRFAILSVPLHLAYSVNAIVALVTGVISARIRLFLR